MILLGWTKKLVRQQVCRLVEKHTTGPIPSGSEMQAYRDVAPDLPRLIFDLAMRGQGHRHALATKDQEQSFAAFNTSENNKRLAVSRGQWLGFTIAVFVLLLAGLMAILGFATLAMIFAAVDVVGLAAVFAGSSRSAQTNGGQQNGTEA